MKDEIKEILAYFEEYVKITDMHDSEPMLNWKDLKIVLDYITNLQQENHELKSKLECYENGAYYSSKVDELEQENEKLNSMLNNADNKNLSLIEEINEKYDIIEKAIEYNKEIVNNYLEEDNCEYCDGRYATAKHNLNILQNGSEDNEKVNL